MVCQGVGSIGLGAAALAHAEPSAVARAVELYLEGKARSAKRLPHTQHRASIEAAMAELAAAGIITNALDRAAPQAPRRRRHPEGPVADSVAEVKAVQLALDLGAPVTGDSARALGREPVALGTARRRGAPFPHASAAGHTAALCVAADPIDPLGPDVGMPGGRAGRS